MDVTGYVDRLRADLTAAAATGDDPVRDAGERLAAAVGPALRLTLMEVLSEAAAEVTSRLEHTTVEARLHGRDIELVVDRPAPGVAEPAPEPATTDDEGELARITVRLPEVVKTRAEQYAGRRGQSLNTWIVGVLRQATRGSGIDVDIDLSSIPLVGDDFPFGGSRGPRRMSGWV